MSLLRELYNQLPEASKRFSRKQAELAVLIAKYIDLHGMTQREFSTRIGMKESRLSKILSGDTNMTLKAIVNLEVELGAELIFIPDFENTTIYNESSNYMLVDKAFVLNYDSVYPNPQVDDSEQAAPNDYQQVDKTYVSKHSSAYKEAI